MINSQPCPAKEFVESLDVGDVGWSTTILVIWKGNGIDTRRSKCTVRRVRCEEQVRREQSKDLCCKSAPSCSRIEQRVQTAQTSGPVQSTVLQHRTAYRLALESAVLVTRISTFRKCSFQSVGCFVAHLQNVVCLNVLFGKVGEGSNREIWLEFGKPLRPVTFPRHKNSCKRPQNGILRGHIV